MRASWAGPGYELGSRLGRHPAADLWHAVEVATAAPVVLRRLPAGADLAAVRRNAVLLRTLPTPYLLRIRTVLEVRQRVVVVTDLAAGGSLAELVARRGCLDPGEAVTVAVALAHGLAALHARGLVHAGPALPDVLLTDHGLPLLATGLAAGRTPARPGADAGGTLGATAADDVAAMVALCQQLLGGGRILRRPDVAAAGADPPSALAVLLADVLASPPERRRSAAELATALAATQRPEPVRLGAGAAPSDVLVVPSQAPVSGPRAQPVRPVRPRSLTALTVLLAVAAAAGWLSVRGGPADLAAASAPPLHGPSAGPAPSPGGSAPSPDAPSPDAPSPDAPMDAAAWRQVLVGLDAARDRALSTADPGLLFLADAPGSALLAADRAVIGELRREGESARGGRHGVRKVVVLGRAPSLTSLLVVDELSGYDLVDRDGRLVAHRSARPAAAFDVMIARTPMGYRLQRVTPR